MKCERVDSGLPSVIVAAHELKSPLVLMRQLALGAADEAISNSERQQLLGQLELVADKSLRTVADLTRTVRLQPELVPLEPVNAWQLCEEVVQEISPLYKAHGRQIELRASRPKSLVVANRQLLASVIYHFVNNALQYGETASVVKVGLQRRPKEQKVRISVRDQGPSVSLHDWRSARKLQAKKLSTTTLSSGLGMYIADQFSTAIGGSLGLVRHRDGATFFIDIPISEQLRLL